MVVTKIYWYPLCLKFDYVQLFQHIDGLVVRSIWDWSYIDFYVQTKFFLRFYVCHFWVVIGQHAFEKLKPFFVRRMKDHTTCCIYHVEIDELCITFNNMQKSTHGSDCACKC